jgi:hypothetical protein
MFNSTAYSGDYSKAMLLGEQLRERVFLKTELDVVYTDFSNWERGGLLYKYDDATKGKWRVLNYFEYTWVKIVERLRMFGFSYDYIRQIKSALFQELDLIELKNTVRDNMDVVLGKGVDDQMKQLVDYSDEEISQTNENLKFFESLLVYVIYNKEKYSLLFFPDMPGFFMPISAEMMRTYSQKMMDDQTSTLLEKNYVSVSLSGIISNYLKDGKEAFEHRTTTVLTKEEHAMLKVIRNKPKDLKSIKIKFTNQDAHLIEVSSLKKVQLESRLMDHIKKGDYLTIEIITDARGILKYENTQKIKV